MLTVYHRPGAGRPIRLVWALEEAGADYELVVLTPEEVRGFCEGQIAHNKIPRYVEFVEAFPLTVTGKAQKFLMRQAVEERLGLKRAATA